VNEILQTTDGRSTLRIERRLAHPADKVWRAVTQPSHLAAWFPYGVEVPELAVGGKLRFVGEDDEPPTEGEITELDPPWIFGFTWNDDALRIELRPTDGGRATLLVFTHAFADTAGGASFAAGWEACLAALDTSLHGEGGDGGDAGDEAVPPAPGGMDDRHEHFVAAFGLAEGTVAATGEGWRVRFERQLVRPAETAWAVLLDGAGEPAVGGPVPPGFTTDAFPAGPVTAVEPAVALAYEWHHEGAPAGEVRWELTTGTGQGARLVVTQTGPADRAAARQTALAAWRDHVEGFARSLTATPSPRAAEQN
jgi:uncharacterized protein YndB with AHSA1/START domain